VEEGYILCSVAVDLKVSEVVDALSWVVSAFVPLSIFHGLPAGICFTLPEWSVGGSLGWPVAADLRG
jgi:hypothetical protein